MLQLMPKSADDSCLDSFKTLVDTVCHATWPGTVKTCLVKHLEQQAGQQKPVSISFY